MSSRRNKKTAHHNPTTEPKVPVSDSPKGEDKAHTLGGQEPEEVGPQFGPQFTSNDQSEKSDAPSNNVDRPILDAEIKTDPINHHEAESDREPAATPKTTQGGDQIAPNEIGDASTGTEIVVGDLFGGMLDARIEEPTYPVSEWQGPADPPLVVPDETASNEALIEGARRLVQIVGWRMRRTVQEWWVIGRHLCILKSRPENQGRWRKEILAEIGVNHTTDHQLRAMAEKLTFEQCLDFTGKTEALKAIGFFAPSPSRMQIDFQPNAEVEEILGLGDAESYNFGGLDSLPQAAPIEELQPNLGMQPGPDIDIAAEAARPAKATSKPQPASKPEAQKIAAKAQPKDQADAIAQPQEEHDPIAEGEALVVTLGGANVADMEAALSNTPFSVIAKTPKRVVGLLWYAEDDYAHAAAKAGEALKKLRDVRQNFLVEAHYLRPLEVIAL